MKKVAILTSGGDAPGMNSCLRACVRYAISKGIDIYGVQRGYEGLINNELTQLNSRSVSDIIQRGGTILKSARSSDFRTIEGQKKAFETLQAYGINDLIAIGGDGTYRGAKALSDNFGINVIGLPGTIDNDLAYTDYTIGFDTAVNTVLWAINSLRDTMGSHDRVSMLEVMGRHCGDIALYAGLCGGAEFILVPEITYDIDEIASTLRKSQKRGKTSNMIVFAEGAGDREEICRQLSEKCGVKITTTVLGHIQRGGSPTMMDRMLSANMAVRAVDLICENKTNRVVGIRNNEIIDDDLTEALEMKNVFNKRMFEIAGILGR